MSISMSRIFRIKLREILKFNQNTTCPINNWVKNSNNFSKAPRTPRESLAIMMFELILYPPIPFLAWKIQWGVAWEINNDWLALKIFNVQGKASALTLTCGWPGSFLGWRRRTCACRGRTAGSPAATIKTPSSLSPRSPRTSSPSYGSCRSARCRRHCGRAACPRRGCRCRRQRCSLAPGDPGGPALQNRCLTTRSQEWLGLNCSDERFFHSLFARFWEDNVCVRTPQPWIYWGQIKQPLNIECRGVSFVWGCLSFGLLSSVDIAKLGNQLSCWQSANFVPESEAPITDIFSLAALASISLASSLLLLLPSFSSLLFSSLSASLFLSLTGSFSPRAITLQKGSWWENFVEASQVRMMGRSKLYWRARQ